jgi:plasmid stabilization system protein ParE
MHRIDWTRRALADLDRVEQFLRAKNPYAAERAVRTILDAVTQLSAFPVAGRLARGGFRELPFRFSNGGYVVLYLVHDDFVQIVRIRHMREAGY